MPKKALIVPALVILLLGAAAYRLVIAPATLDSVIQPYLKGEMANLSVPDEKTMISDHMIMQADGSPIRLSEMKGKVILLNLWASWCAPCRSEMKELANLQRQLGDDRFEVVAISVDRGGIAEIRETLAEWGIEGLNLYAEPTMKIAADLAGGALPTSLIIDEDGQVLAKYLGPLKWDAPEALELFSALKEAVS
ncbi:TlpA disulfide reductase family protein [Kordiimonas pumila]|uniref:TlpA disulfide reductase family protein n=1 Tax=Kordiimonas pumila TaxID=2161677 RepID=A0ABV7CZY3_9PROT|nr:TlpA disulfide reductase family protein [Kordiimonas pumila]